MTKLTALDASELAAINELVDQILENPLMMQRLSDRIYDLMLEELRLLRERDRGYGRRS